VKANSGLLHRDSPMTAHQESNESKDARKNAWHVSRLFAFIPFEANHLQADGTLANDSTTRRLPATSGKRLTP
jgi:hypothetical protein